VVVDEQTQIEDSLVLPGARIGKRCRIRNAIIDSQTCIPDGTEIGYDREQDLLRYHVTERGIVVVTPPELPRQLAGCNVEEDRFAPIQHTLPLQAHG
jgi:glucose-1-phosphate adenylyltransferase